MPSTFRVLLDLQVLLEEQGDPEQMVPMEIPVVPVVVDLLEIL